MIEFSHDLIFFGEDFDDDFDEDFDDPPERDRERSFSLFFVSIDTRDEGGKGICTVLSDNSEFLRIGGVFCNDDQEVRRDLSSSKGFPLIGL